MKFDELRDALLPPEWRRDLADPALWGAAACFAVTASVAAAGLLLAGGATWL
ncbi:hypothetical protein [Gordonibacter pamelaeae]|uniref:hypothetical protein n=1 Tax=Gordonibacter pamelaeae TaxID=471189 RepID=UPI003A8EB0B1